MDGIATTPNPPYYAVVFTSIQTGEDESGYAVTSERMLALARDQAGYLGVETAHAAGGVGITVSYWRSRDDIKQWRRNAEHRAAQEAGRARWYRAYGLRVCRVEHEIISREGERAARAMSEGEACAPY